MGEIRNNFKKAMSDMFGVGAEQDTPNQQSAPVEVNTPNPTPTEPTTAPTKPDPELPKIEPQKPQVTPSFSLPEVESVEETYISKDTVICGDIQSGSDLRIKGKVAGNITCDNNVMLSGKLEGNLAGKSALIDGGQIVGNVEMRGDLRIQHDARIKGDLQCSNLDLDSVVDGNLRTQHKTVFHANATVIGNITTQTFVVEEGAMIEGYISMKDMQSRVGRPNLDRETDK